MKERPILFSAPMVRAILEGRKTMTRRTTWLEYLNEKPDDWFIDQRDGIMTNRATGECRGINKTCRPYDFMCPCGQPGDRLWVRETFAPRYFDNGKPAYRADLDGKAADLVPEPRWSPSIHMPRWASRLSLEVTAVRVERLQDISEEDGRAEGADKGFEMDVAEFVTGKPIKNETYRTGFRLLWDSINAKRGYGWDANPWVWVVEFKRVEP